jgi:hypothetical protein
VAIPHHYAFGSQPLRLFTFVPRNEPADRVHHSPPGHVLVRGGKDVTNEPRAPGEAGVVRNIAVRHDLARAKRAEDVEDPRHALSAGGRCRPLHGVPA